MTMLMMMHLRVVVTIIINIVIRGLFRQNIQIILFKNPKSSLASANSPSSIPSPTYQCTNARCEYIKSYFLDMRSENTRLIAVLLPIKQTLFTTSATSSHSSTVGGRSFNPTLTPVGHHSTNVHFLLVFNHCTVAFASFDWTVPRKFKLNAIYLS